jgi:cell division protein FtsI (penicillin-binding protein 3)
MGIWIKRKTAQLENGIAPAFELDAKKKKSGNRARNRVMMAMMCFVGISRPDILDRNGEVLATDIRTVSLFAEPNKIVDADEAVEKLTTVLPDLDMKGTYKKLSNRTSHFAWLRRQLTPKQQSQILALGIPGIGFRPRSAASIPAARPRRTFSATSISTTAALPAWRSISTTRALPISPPSA